MAKRKKAKKSASKTPARKRRVRVKPSAAEIAPETGPVTLDEAKALAGVTPARRAVSAGREAAAVAPSVAAVGAEREKLRQEQRDERARRVRDYKAVMEIMKARGARPPRTGRRGAGGAETAAERGGAFAPLQIFAEGDSWFEYPAPFFGGSIVPRLENKLGVPILNLAKAGDEVRYMLGVEERTVLAEHLTSGSPAGDPWDVLLFSGGGNDIVDNPMALWVTDWNPALPPVSHINQPRFNAALALVRAGYEDLITLRDKLSPNTHLIFQGYDFAIPDGRGICNYGPWLKPTFDLRKFPTLAAGQAVVKALLQQFETMLIALTGPKVMYINTQGTLAPQTASWHNELHPAKAGFEKFADLFHEKLKTLFPARVA
jgi:hypothetical protein